MPEHYSNQLSAMLQDAYNNNVGTHLGGKRRAFVTDVDLDGAAIDDIAVMASLGKGCVILGGYIVADALGTSVTVSCGRRYRDDRNQIIAGKGTATDLLTATSMNSAGKVTDLIRNMPVPESDGEVCEVYLTIAGAAATGKVSLVLDYIEWID